MVQPGGESLPVYPFPASQPVGTPTVPPDNEPSAAVTDDVPLTGPVKNEVAP